MASHDGGAAQHDAGEAVGVTSSQRTAMSSPGRPNETVHDASEPKSDPTNFELPTPNPRLQAILAKKVTLEATLASLQEQRSALVAEARLPSGLAMPDSWSEEEKTKSALTNANAVIKEHICLLHEYNEIKDIGQGLMGLIADSRGVRVATVMEDFGMDEKD
ncbi:hypothetical protein LTR37_005985 [Vermiconidia calcicola]|uniref:Uncharacterized protein n=1 Tax=Vermiconidia calcicola TaxID=1690605 RepID=A0ACC3NI85_9PEZI|nr:hypothetical protein LTR37_005985 [Vermiconidia calcicola]